MPAKKPRILANGKKGQKKNKMEDSNKCNNNNVENVVLFVANHKNDDAVFKSDGG